MTTTTPAPIAAADDLDAIDCAGRLARFGLQQLEKGLANIGTDPDRFGWAIDALENAQSHIMRAVHEVAVADIRTELRRRFPTAVALELNLTGRTLHTIRHTPRRVIGPDGETLWSYREAFSLVNDDRPQWERQLEASCVCLNVTDLVPEHIASVGPVILL